MERCCGGHDWEEDAAAPTVIEGDSAIGQLKKAERSGRHKQV
jgi:hypothetical protein